MFNIHKQDMKTLVSLVTSHMLHKVPATFFNFLKRTQSQNKNIKELFTLMTPEDKTVSVPGISVVQQRATKLRQF